jgi:Fe-S cluster assembly iron-binding protein IscA
MNQISISAEAEQYFKKYTHSMGAIGVRLGLKPTGCAGYGYVWDLVYDYHAQNEPVLQHQDGFVLLVGSDNLDLLLGSQVTLENSAHSQVIRVTSARQADSCGCGESVTFYD